MARPIRPVPMIAMVLPVTSSPRKGRYGCQKPHLFSRVRCSAVHSLSRQRAQHEKGEFRGGFGEHIRSVSKRNLVPVGVGAVDVVEAHGDLGDNFQFPLARFEHLGIDGVAQSSNQPIDAGLHFFDHQALRRRLRLRVHFDLVSPLAKQIDRLTDIASGKDAKFVGHGSPRSDFDCSFAGCGFHQAENFQRVALLMNFFSYSPNTTRG